jgi:hypothetical protein
VAGAALAHVPLAGAAAGSAPNADPPPLVQPLPPRWPDAPPQPAGAPAFPGADRSRPSPPSSVLAVPALFSATGGSLVRGISDGRLTENDDEVIRARAMRDVSALGASVVRLPLSWAAALPDAPPADATDPDDPAYVWSRQDAAVRSAVAAGLQPLLVISHAPVYAEAPHRWRWAARGSWAPSPSELGAFATAVARRYSGSWPDPQRPGRALPRVAAFQAWNEPNLPNYLTPQWVVRGGRWVPWAPVHYRLMLNAFAAAVRAVQPRATIVSAGLAPNGEGADGAGRMTPVRFLRAMLCLGAPPSDGPVSCPAPADFDVLAFHPLSVGDPDARARSALDVSVGDVEKVGAVLRLAERHGLLARPAPSLWITELNWTSAAIPADRRAAAVGRGLHRLWAAGAQQVTWHFLEDPPDLPDREAGLRTRGAAGPLSGARKAYARGFALPFDVGRIDAGRVGAWAVPNVDGPLRLQRRRGARWVTVSRVPRARRDRPVRFVVRAGGGVRLRVAGAGMASAAIAVP